MIFYSPMVNILSKTEFVESITILQVELSKNFCAKLSKIGSLRASSHFRCCNQCGTSGERSEPAKGLARVISRARPLANS